MIADCWYVAMSVDNELKENFLPSVQKDRVMYQGNDSREF
jgi:hypothetical protein